MSGGRVELGLGTGWYAAEHTAYGIPYPETVERFDRFAEQVEIIDGLLRTPAGQTYSFAGKHYQLTDSPALPKPVQRPRPPMILGGAAKPRGARARRPLRRRVQRRLRQAGHGGQDRAGARRRRRGRPHPGLLRGAGAVRRTGRGRAGAPRRRDRPRGRRAARERPRRHARRSRRRHRQARRSRRHPRLPAGAGPGRPRPPGPSRRAKSFRTYRASEGRGGGTSSPARAWMGLAPERGTSEAGCARGGWCPRAHANPPLTTSRARRRPGSPRCGCARRSWRSRRTGSCARSPRTGTAWPAMSATVAPSRAATSTSRSRPVSGDVPPASVAAASAGSTTRSPRCSRRTASASCSAGASLTTKPSGAGLHRAAQVAGPAEGGQDQHPAARQLVGQRRGGGQAVHAGHLDVQQRDVRIGGQRGGDDLVAAADLGDDGEVVLEFEQGDQRGADQRLVVGDQQPDHGLTPAHAGAVDRAVGAGRRAGARRGSRDLDAHPPARPPWARGHGAAGGRDALAQPGQAVARAGGDRAAPVVDDGRASAARAHGAVRGARVPHHVGERLAQHPAEQLGQLAARRRRPSRAARR